MESEERQDDEGLPNMNVTIPSDLDRILSEIFWPQVKGLKVEVNPILDNRD